VLYDDEQPPLLMPWEDRPGYSQAEMIASDALRWMGTPREQLAMIRPPVPQQLFPPRFGYVHEPVTVEDIFYGDWTPRQRSWVSPPIATPRRRYEEEQMWSGTDRNVSISTSPLG
jgi:hypothetical protein